MDLFGEFWMDRHETIGMVECVRLGVFSLMENVKLWKNVLPCGFVFHSL